MLHRILFTTMTLLALTLPGQAQTLSVKGNARQGNPLFLAVLEAPEGATGKILWGGHSYTLGERDEQGAMRAVIPVPVDLAARAQSLKVELSTGQTLERQVKVQPRHFSTQYLTINADTLASYDKPQNKADDEAIKAALRKWDNVMRWSGMFVIPVEAPETTGFGLRRLYNGWKKGWHKGLDLGAWEGEAVRAPNAGIVIHTARGIVNGNTVVLSHGLGLGTVYLHLQDIAVRPGQVVESGEVIGHVGGTGGFAPHLHYEARVQAEPIDPKSLYALPEGWR